MISEKEFIEKIGMFVSRPGMFGIQKIEDVFLLFTAEVHINQNQSVSDWSRRFTDFVIEECNPELRNFDWSRIIRLYSGSDSHSIDLFKALLAKFQETKRGTDL